MSCGLAAPDVRFLISDHVISIFGQTLFEIPRLRTIRKPKTLDDRKKRFHCEERGAFFHLLRNDPPTSLGHNAIHLPQYIR